MRRLLSAIINFKLCIWTAIGIRLLFAIPHRWLLGMARPVELYLPGDGIFGELFFAVPMLVICLYHFFVQRFMSGITLGERIAGVRIRTKWNLWHALLEGVSVIIWPVSLCQLWIFGTMPCDCMPGTEIWHTGKTYRRVTGRKHSAEMIFLKLLAILSGWVMLLAVFEPEILDTDISRLYRQHQWYLYQRYQESDSLCPQIPWMLRDWYIAEYIADVYSGNVELEIRCVEEFTVPEMKMGSLPVVPSGEPGGWLFVIGDLEGDLAGYQELGIDLNHCDCRKNMLAVTFGRKIKVASIQPGWAYYSRWVDDEIQCREPIVNFRFLLEKEYTENLICIYEIPRIMTQRVADDCMEEIRWWQTDYYYYENIDWIMPGYEPEHKAWIETGGIFREWLWAYHIAVEGMKRDTENYINVWQEEYGYTVYNCWKQK